MVQDIKKDFSLNTWWEKFIPFKRYKKDHVFGVPLESSMEYTKTTVVYTDNGVRCVGHIPTVIAKCGAFLKEQGLEIEGIFRVSGSAKRVGELQKIFSRPSNYGQNIEWEGYTAHDVATLLRRYLNQLPKPVIVPTLYSCFHRAMETEDEDSKMKHFRLLIEDLSVNHQHLLFYLLDLMSLFAQHADVTKMSSSNLAAIFTPGILMGPDNSSNPIQYKDSQKVIQFLIDHHDAFKAPKEPWLSSPANL